MKSGSPEVPFQTQGDSNMFHLICIIEAISYVNYAHIKAKKMPAISALNYTAKYKLKESLLLNLCVPFALAVASVVVLVGVLGHPCTKLNGALY